MVKRSCETCDYWEGHKHECRRQSPREVDTDGYGQFPGINSDEWCGEWKRKPDTYTKEEEEWIKSQPNGEWPP